MLPMCRPSSEAGRSRRPEKYFFKLFRTSVNRKVAGPLFGAYTFPIHCVILRLFPAWEKVEGARLDAVSATV
jgi:hypothetical protein